MARPNTTDSNRYLDNNNRLSSAGAAQSLRYARPQDLPSYPTSGLPPNRQNQDATTAATLGWQNQKSYEPWKPAPSGAAATAATRGWGTTAAPQWQPEQSMSGARAAVLAAQRNKNLPAQGVTAPPAPAPRPAPSAWGNTAANLAVSNSRAKGPGTATPPNTTYRPSDIDRHGSLMAATGAMANGPRRRADSNPVARPTYPDQANARSNALRAATMAQSNSQIPETVPVGGAIPAVHMPRNKFGYNPGSQPVADAKTHEEALQSSAVAMAQAMYKIMEKNKSDKEATAGASGAMGRDRALSLSSGDDAAVKPMQFGNIHDKAQILAARRLADMHDEEAQSREYREYYAGQFGPPPGQSPPSTKRFSLGNMFSRNRRNSDDSLEDDVETRKIRAQMAVFQSSLSKVDNQTRQSDRERLMAIAQQNVRKDLQDIDQKVYSKTGKATPQMQAQWEREHYARQQAEMHAQQQHEERMMNHGRVDIGGGHYMDQEQIDELARRNVQPVLDNIETHNQERIDSEESKRFDAEERQRQAVIDRQREKEGKELEKTIKQQMKEEARAKKEEEKLTRKQSRKGSRLSRFGSLSRSTHANQPVASSSSPESTHLVSDAAPVLAPVPATQPLNLNGQKDGVDDSQHMSGAIRTTTTDTERPTRESASFVSANAEPAPAAVAPVAPVEPTPAATAPVAPVEPAAVPLPAHGSDTDLANEANQDMRNEIPVSETIYDPYLNHTAVPAQMSVVPIVPFQTDQKKVHPPAKPTGAPAPAPAPAPVVATDAPTGTTGPAPNTTKYENLPAATPPAEDLQQPGNTSGTTTIAETKAGKSSPEGSPKQKKGVKGWLKKAFHRGSSSDNDAKLGRKASKRNSKVVKEDPKGKKAIGEPQAVNTLNADGKPAETTNIGIRKENGKEGMGEGNLTQTQATQPASGTSTGPSGSGGAVATSGPLDSHPDVHAVDRTLYDATPPVVGGAATGTSSLDQRQSMIDYERDQERARGDEEVAVSDIDEELVARTRGGQVASQDASTVSMMSQGSMERRRIAALQEEEKAGQLPNERNNAEMEKAAEREEREEMRREERDEVDSIQGPRFTGGRERAGSEARETRFHEDV